MGWQEPFDVLRKKWVEIPTTRVERKKTTELLELADMELLSRWQAVLEDNTKGAGFSVRGWYHALYTSGMGGKKVLDVGSGFGIDSITFAQHGAHLTFVDLVQSNLDVLKRLCKILGISDAHFVQLKDLDSLKALDNDYDVIMAMGSLHNAPESVMWPEYQELVKHLKVGGRWLQLAYPKTRWIREGKQPFSRWGEYTDGVGTPWCEWYDLPKLLSLFSPRRFEVVLYQEFHNSDFNWFDLLYMG